MIDIHSHILPGIDDGAPNMETTELFLDLISGSAVTAVVCTPHYRQGIYHNEKKYMIEVFQKTNDLKIAKGYKFQLYCAAEVFLKGESIITDIQNNAFMINGTPFVLVENNFYGFSDDFYINLYHLVFLGFKPILAHPERYENIQNNIMLAEEFMHRDVYLQINTSSILGHNGNKCQAIALELIDRGYVHFLGSDCHCRSDSYDYDLAVELISKEFNPKLANTLALVNPEKMLHNEYIPYFYQSVQTYTPKKNLFQFFKK